MIGESLPAFSMWEEQPAFHEDGIVEERPWSYSGDKLLPHEEFPARRKWSFELINELSTEAADSSNPYVLGGLALPTPSSMDGSSMEVTSRAVSDDHCETMSKCDSISQRACVSEIRAKSDKVDKKAKTVLKEKKTILTKKITEKKCKKSSVHNSDLATNDDMSDQETETQPYEDSESEDCAESDFTKLTEELGMLSVKEEMEMGELERKVTQMCMNCKLSTNEIPTSEEIECHKDHCSLLDCALKYHIVPLFVKGLKETCKEDERAPELSDDRDYFPLEEEEKSRKTDSTKCSGKSVKVSKKKEKKQANDQGKFVMVSRERNDQHLALFLQAWKWSIYGEFKKKHGLLIKARNAMMEDLNLNEDMVNRIFRVLPFDRSGNCDKKYTQNDVYLNADAVRTIYTNNALFEKLNINSIREMINWLQEKTQKKIRSNIMNHLRTACASSADPHERRIHLEEKLGQHRTTKRPSTYMENFLAARAFLSKLKSRITKDLKDPEFAEMSRELEQKSKIISKTLAEVESEMEKTFGKRPEGCKKGGNYILLE